MKQDKSLRDRVNQGDLKAFRNGFQIVAFVLLVYGGFVGFDLGDKLPSFACVFNSEGRGGVCYLGILQHDLNHSFESFMGYAGVMFLISLVVFILWFALLNKAWCGFVCPLGTLQDWMTGVRRRLGVRYSEYRWRTRKRIQIIKYVLLALLILIPIGISNPLFGLDKLPQGLSMPFCKICPGRMLVPLFTGDYSQFYLDFSSTSGLVITSLGIMVLGLFLVGAFVKKRFFCYFCPFSALHFLFSKAAALKLIKTGEKCTRCGDCFRACDMDIVEIADDIKTVNLVTEDCTLCLKCVASCPEEGALRVAFLGKTLFESTEAGFQKRMQKAQHNESV
ncbi:MAG: 4Fe-4S binding protein [Candidatus Thiodiazotropha sp.]